MNNQYIAYKAKEPRYHMWARNWIRFGHDYSCPRRTLFGQVVTIRKEHGSKEALEFIRYLHWLEAYPARKSRKGDACGSL